MLSSNKNVFNRDKSPFVKYHELGIILNGNDST